MYDSRTDRPVIPGTHHAGNASVSKEDTWARRVTRRADRREARRVIASGNFDALRMMPKPGTSGWLTW